MAVRGVAALLAAAALAGAAAGDPLVYTTNGYVQGFVQDGVNVFNGIPFAAPPVGDLRFAAPAPAANWTGTKDVSALPPICPQVKLDGDLALSEDEDCLYLHVYAPEGATDGEPLPVMFWIFGGGWALGDSFEFGWYDGVNVAKKRNVVIVAANYRVGPFGFLALDELAAEDPHGSTGNAGLQDQTAALQWTRDNIGHFGGDPDRVMMYGESAGGFSVCWHLVSPASAGLFSSAVMESGSCSAPQFFQARDYAVGFGNTWADAVGCEGLTGPPLLTCMRALDPNHLMKSVGDWLNPNWPFTGASASAGDSDSLQAAKGVVERLARGMATAAESRHAARGRALTPALRRSLAAQAAAAANKAVLPALAPIMPWGAAIDGASTGLAGVPLDLMRAGKFNRVPFVLGTNADEGSIFVPFLPIIAKGASFPPDNASLVLALSHLFNMYNASAVAAITPAVLGHYPLAAFHGDAWARGTAILTDYFFRCDARRTARAVVNATAAPPVWLYLFDYKLDWIEGPILGDYHTSELCFVWDNAWPPLLHDFSERDQEMSDAVTAYWSNLARGGSPNTPSVPLAWPAYTWPAGATPDANINLHLPLSAGSGLQAATCDFWDSVDAKLRAAG